MAPTISIGPRRPTGAPRPAASGRLRCFLAFATALTSASFPSARPATAAEFARGDGNRDGRVDVSDAIGLLQHLFNGGAGPACDDAADANDDGVLTITDAVRILGALFQGAMSIPAPHPEAGTDPTPDALGCAGDADRLPAGSIEADAAFGGSWTGPPALPAAGDWPPPDSVPIIVDAASFRNLAAVAAGTPLGELRDGAIDPAILDALEAAVAAAAGPVVQGAHLTVPLAFDAECWEVHPALLDAGSFSPGSVAPFRRGDLDGDGAVGDADLRLLETAVMSAPERSLPPAAVLCPDAFDIDDDGSIDSRDVERLSGFLDYGSPAIPYPRGECGMDPTPDALPSCLRGACPESPLAFRVDPPVICGPGPHSVTLTARDAFGREASGRALVRLCSAEDPECPGEIRSDAPGGEPSRSAGLSCRWVVTIYDDPDTSSRSVVQNVYEGDKLSGVHREPPYDLQAASTWQIAVAGPGPTHHLVTRRTRARCAMPASSLTSARGGTLQVGVNLICADGETRVVFPPCPSLIVAEGYYASELQVETAVGGTCAGAPVRVEAMAEDAAELRMDELVLFSKGTSIQNGTHVVSSPSSSLAVKPKIALDLSAELEARFGLAHEVRNATGTIEAQLAASGNGQRRTLPVLVTLESAGKAFLHGERDAEAYARVTSRAAGIWLVGLSGCPGAGNFPLVAIRAVDRYRDGLESRAAKFLELNLGEAPKGDVK